MQVPVQVLYLPVQGPLGAELSFVKDPLWCQAGALSGEVGCSSWRCQEALLY